MTKPKPKRKPVAKKPAPAGDKLTPTELVRTGTISADPANVRKHSARNIEAIMASLRKFGQQKPIICTKNRVVIAGNGTLEAVRRLGWPEIMVRFTALTGADAIAYAIADNRTADLAEWDLPALKDILQGLDDGQFDMDATGFTMEELEQLMTATVPDEAKEPKEKQPHKCPNCGTEF